MAAPYIAGSIASPGIIHRSPATPAAQPVLPGATQGMRQQARRQHAAGRSSASRTGTCRYARGAGKPQAGKVRTNAACSHFEEQRPAIGGGGDGDWRRRRRQGSGVPGSCERSLRSPASWNPDDAHLRGTCGVLALRRWPSALEFCWAVQRWGCLRLQSSRFSGNRRSSQRPCEPFHPAGTPPPLRPLLLRPLRACRADASRAGRGHLCGTEAHQQGWQQA